MAAALKFSTPREPYDFADVPPALAQRLRRLKNKVRGAIDVRSRVIYVVRDQFPGRSSFSPATVDRPPLGADGVGAVAIERRSLAKSEPPATLGSMQAWLTLLAAVAGAAIALAGQQVARRGDERRQTGERLLEEAAQVAALAEDFTNRIWEERTLGLAGQVDGWDLRGDRLSAARLRILSDDAILIAALDELHAAGISLGAYWRAGSSDPDDFEARRVRY